MEGSSLFWTLQAPKFLGSMPNSFQWRKLTLLSVFLVSIVANFDTAERYLARVESGWMLWMLCVLAALLPLFCFLPETWLRRTWKGLAVASVGVAIYSWWKIPVDSLRVDRWELMSNFLARLFHGDYPYLASSRFNVPPPVPFPWLYLVSIPAWLAGEIGLFPLACLAILVWSTPDKYRPRMLWALATSLPVWYEVAVRSNIVANAALVGAFIQTDPGRKTSSVARNALLAGIVLCTRASFIAPVLLWFGSVFLRRKRWKDAGVWGGIASVVAILPFVGLIAIWGWPLFREWNPLRFQGAIQSPWLPLAILAMSPLVGAAIRSTRDRFLAAYLVVLAPMLTLLLPVLLDGSWLQPNRGFFEVAFWNSALVLGLQAWARSNESDPQG